MQPFRGLDAYFLPPKILLPVLATLGGLCTPDAADMPVVREWLKNFYEETLHRKPPDLTLNPTEGEPSVSLFVWRDEHDRMVGMGMLADSEKTCRLNLIYVAPEFREQGYGRAIVTELARLARERRLVPVLYVAPENELALKIYTSLGFCEVQK